MEAPVALSVEIGQVGQAMRYQINRDPIIPCKGGVGVVEAPVSLRVETGKISHGARDVLPPRHLHAFRGITWPNLHQTRPST